MIEVSGKWRECEWIERGEVIESWSQGIGLRKRNDDARALRIVGQQGMQVVEIFAQQKCGAMGLGDGRVGGPISQLRSDGAELIVCRARRGRHNQIGILDEDGHTDGLIWLEAREVGTKAQVVSEHVNGFTRCSWQRFVLIGRP